MYYIPIGSVTGIVVGLLVSFCTGCSDLKNINPTLITPLMRRFLPKYDNAPEKYDSVAQEIKLDFVELKK